MMNFSIQHTKSSRSHSRNTNFRRPHSIEKTSERIDAEVNVSCTPERSTVRGLVGDVFYKEQWVLERQKRLLFLPSKPPWSQGLVAHRILRNIRGRRTRPYPWTTIPQTLDYQGCPEQLFFAALFPCLLSPVSRPSRLGLKVDLSKRWGIR